MASTFSMGNEIRGKLIERIIDKIIDQNEGQMDERTLLTIEKVLSRVDRADVLVGSGTGTVSTAPATGGTTAAPTTGTVAIRELALTRVGPGDLITAAYMNSLVDALFELNKRLSVLEKPAAHEEPKKDPPPVKDPPKPRNEARPTIKIAAYAQNPKVLASGDVKLAIAAVGENLGNIKAARIMGTNSLTGKPVEEQIREFASTANTAGFHATVSKAIARDLGREFGLEIIAEGGEDRISLIPAEGAIAEQLAKVAAGRDVREVLKVATKLLG
jgi:hypothetical protein